MMIVFKVFTKKYVKYGASQFQNFHVNLHKFHTTLLYEIITVRLGCHKFWAKWVLKMLMSAHKMQRMALVFAEFFRVIPQR
jgi:hypothetical protein